MKKVKALLYCTKKAPYLVKDDFPYENEPIYFTHYKEPGSWGLPLNGKIVAECEVETEEISLSAYSDYEDTIYLFDTPTLRNDELTQKSCLFNDELDDYLINEKGYALHISNLKTFAKPKELYEYNIIKASQNIMRVYDRFGNKYILISIRPEWLCKILNGEKTIEVRKKVLKEML